MSSAAFLMLLVLPVRMMFRNRPLKPVPPLFCLSAAEPMKGVCEGVKVDRCLSQTGKSKNER